MVLDTITSMIGPVSGGELALVSATIVLAGFIRGFLGFGAALINVMVLSLVVGPHAAVPISSLTGLAATLHLLPVAVRHAERGFVVPFSIAAFIARPSAPGYW